MDPQPPPVYAAAPNDQQVRPGVEQGEPVYPPPVQQPYPRGEHEPSQ